jgi:hypothetical protein
MVVLEKEKYGYFIVGVDGDPELYRSV